MGRWLAWTNGWGRAAVRKEGEAAAMLGYCLPFIVSIFLSWRGFSQSCWYPSLKLKPWARDCKKALEKSFFSLSEVLGSGALWCWVIVTHVTSGVPCEGPLWLSPPYLGCLPLLYVGFHDLLSVTDWEDLSVHPWDIFSYVNLTSSYSVDARWCSRERHLRATPNHKSLTIC